MASRGVRLLFVLGTWFAASLAHGQDTREPASDSERTIYVGVYLHDFTSFDQKNGVFDVDFEMWVRWFGEFDPDR
mgnify:CR=1 FL=1